MGTISQQRVKHCIVNRAALQRLASEFSFTLTWRAGRVTVVELTPRGGLRPLPRRFLNFLQAPVCLVVIVVAVVVVVVVVAVVVVVVVVVVAPLCRVVSAVLRRTSG